MKTLLLLLSLSAVGFGQATATSKVALKPYNKCVEEEKRLAVKYGANLGLGYCSGDVSAMRAAGCFADHYEFHGQFLLIDKGGK